MACTPHTHASPIPACTARRSWEYRQQAVKVLGVRPGQDGLQALVDVHIQEASRLMRGQVVEDAFDAAHATSLVVRQTARGGWLIEAIV